MPGKILISADMEGSSSAATPGDVVRGMPAWAEARKSWAQDIGTVTAALFEHGADEVIVCDAHADGSNLEPGMLDPRAGLIRGGPRQFGMLEGIDSGINGVIFLGYHGTAGSCGVLGHAFLTSGIHSIRVNGEPAGEGTINAFLAAHFGVPVVLVSGDDIACQEAERYAPDAQHVIVKRALGRFVAELLPWSGVQRGLAAAAGLAMRQLAARPGISPVPRQGLCAEIEFSSDACALVASAIPGVRRAGPRLVSYACDDAAQWYRCLSAIWTLARAAQGPQYG